MRPPIPANEPQRLAALMECGVLNTPPERVFDDLTRLAAEICDTPIALIPLVAESHQWFKSRLGFDAPGTSRDVAFCAHAILSDEPLIVEDAAADPRFADNPLVVGQPHIRAYAGVPLTTREGYRLGTLCVIDTRRRPFSERQIEALRALAAQAATQLDLRLAIHRMEGIELELHRALREATAANAVKSEFLALITHELRTPLNEIAGSLGLLRKTSLDGRQARYADVADSSSRTLISMVNDVVDLCRIESGDFRLENIPFEPRLLLDEVAAQALPEATKCGATFSTHLAADTPVTLRGDPQRLRQALVNVTNCALRYSARGAVHLHAAIERRTPHDCTLHIEIHDKGARLSQDTIDRLFHAFTRADLATSKRFGNVGISLTLAARLVECMGGRIRIESVDASETVFAFSVVLPLHAARSSADGADARSAQRDCRVLVTERDPIQLEIIEELLRSTGLSVVTARSPREALDLVSRHPFDLALLDCHTDEHEGFACAGEIRRLESLRPLGSQRAIPIVAMTSGGPIAASGEPGAAQVNDSLSVPIDPDEFLATVHRLLGTGSEHRGSPPSRAGAA